MGRQRNIHSKKHLERLQKSHADRPVGFYRKGGKIRPITKAKPKPKTRVVKKVVTKERKGKYIYEFEDHAYTTQEKASNVIESLCRPGKHKWEKGPSPDSECCSKCHLIRFDRKFKTTPKRWKKVDSSGIDMAYGKETSSFVFSQM